VSFTMAVAETSLRNAMSLHVFYYSIVVDA